MIRWGRCLSPSISSSGLIWAIPTERLTSQAFFPLASTAARLMDPVDMVGAFAWQQFGQLQLLWPVSLHVKHHCSAHKRSHSSGYMRDQGSLWLPSFVWACCGGLAPFVWFVFLSFAGCEAVWGWLLYLGFLSSGFGPRGSSILVG